MTVPTKCCGRIKLELAFQGSKVFDHGGPYTDLYLKGEKEIGQAKRDPRLQSSGRLVKFSFEGLDFALEPKTAFYDWLYCTFLWDHREWATSLYKYAGFTDVEFNPHRSINCQARSAALFLSLLQRGVWKAHSHHQQHSLTPSYDPITVRHFAPRTPPLTTSSRRSENKTKGAGLRFCDSQSKERSTVSTTLRIAHRRPDSIIRLFPALHTQTFRPPQSGRNCLQN